MNLQALSKECEKAITERNVALREVAQLKIELQTKTELLVLLQAKRLALEATVRELEGKLANALL